MHISFIRTLSIYSLLYCLVASCDGKTCESFNFERMPFNSTHYKQQLTYTNGTDTVILFPSVVDYSLESKLNPMAHPECNPTFAIEYSPEKIPVLDILYSFSYYPEEKNTEFYININSSDLKIKLNSPFKGDKMMLDNLHHLNSSDSTQMIRKVVLERMRMTEIETYAGTKWTLIKIGK